MISTVLRSVVPLLALAACLSAPLPSSAGQPARCAECGMSVDPASKFGARTVRDGATLPFCDIGDLLTYLNKNGLSPAGSQVRDYPTGEWIGASKAFFVHAERKFRTPMGWGIAAFAKREDAAAFGDPLDVTGILKAVK